MALLGYGKMGKALAQLAPERGFEVRLILDVDENAGGGVHDGDDVRHQLGGCASPRHHGLEAQRPRLRRRSPADSKQRQLAGLGQDWCSAGFLERPQGVGSVLVAGRTRGGRWER